jgi:hypothetical protein
MQGQRCDDRTILEIGGADRVDFLQGLVTNDVTRLKDGLVYAALLTPQGKYMADFFMVPWGETILLDVKTDLAPMLAQRLTIYKLRSKVTITPLDLPVSRGLDPVPEGAFADPRHPDLGWRHYGEIALDPVEIDWDALRIAACVPETGVELNSETYILEAGFERLHGVDFRKGCYVGQEISARMKHKTELRKGLAVVEVDGAAPVGTEITANGKTAGMIYTQANGRAIAYLRFDRAGGDMMAEDATLRLNQE